MIYNEIIDILDGKFISYKIHKHGEVLTMRDVEEKLPFPIDRLLKTLVFRIRDSSWILAVLKGRDRIDYRKLAQALNVRRQDIIRPSVEEIESKLGFQIGGICPIPTKHDIRVVFDKSILELDSVYCGVGRNDRSLEIRLADLLRASGGIIKRIT